MKPDLDPRADFALPLLLTWMAGVMGALLALTGRTALHLHLWHPLFVGALAFAFAAESYLATTLLAVRELDTPHALRWTEWAAAWVLAKLAGTAPVAGGLLKALAGGWERPETWAGTVLYLAAWWFGMRTAFLVAPLRPIRFDPDQELARVDSHTPAYEAIRNLATGIAGAGALLLALLGRGPWLLLLLALPAAGAVLLAADLRQRMTWVLEKLQPPPAVAARWVSQGLALLLAPLLLALVLPAGPVLPVGRLLAYLARSSDTGPLPAPPPPEARAPQAGQGGWQQLLNALPETGPDLQWLVAGIALLLKAMALLAALLLLRAAARQLRDRLGRRQLRGALAVLAVLAGWYEELWQAAGQWLGGWLKQAATVPAEAVGALLGEAGALGRFLPFRGRAPAEPRAALRYYFGRLQAEAGRRGLRREAGATAAEYAARLAEAAPDRAAEIAGLVAAYEQARYSPEPVAPEQASFARRTWVSIIRAIGRR
jgi:hypothetical protein